MQNLPTYVPTEGLILWYPFNENSNDESGNTNDGDVQGPVLTHDRFGEDNSAFMYSHDTPNSEIYVPYNSMFNSDEISVSVWINPSDYSLSSNPGQSVILNRYQYGYSSPSGETFQLKLYDGGIVAVCVVNSFQTEQYLESPGVPLNEWSHIAFTYSLDSFKLYLNGQLVSESSENIQIHTNSISGISIGVSNQANGYWFPFSGIIDDLAMWNKSLLDSEIQQLYESNQTSSGNIYIPQDYSTIQEGINASANGDTVIVSDGIYYENINFGNNNITLKSLNGPESTIIDGLNNYRVIQNFGESIDFTTSIEGFTIQRGFSGDENNDTGKGGAIYTEKSITIKNCIFVNNTCNSNYSSGDGCAIYSKNSLQIDDCIFTDNNGSSDIYINNINDNETYIKNSIFNGNLNNSTTAIKIYTQGNIHNINIDNCTFSYFQYGIVLTKSNLILSNSIFNNFRTAVFHETNDSNPQYDTVIDKCIFSNTANDYSIISSFGNTRVYDSIFTDIYCNRSYGCILNTRRENTNHLFINNTIYNVDGPGTLFGLDAPYQDLQITSSIVWVPSLDENAYFNKTNTTCNIDVWYSNFDIDLPIGINLLGNISSDPLFVDVNSDDFNLQPISPCIDTGDPNAEVDPDGSRADMGALYFNQLDNPIFYGCMDDIACNYDPDANVDDNSCLYEQEYYDCDGNCVSEIDCLGICGGESIVDDCGVCNGSNECFGCTEQDASNYNEDAVFDDGSCFYYEDTFELIFEPTHIYNPDALNNNYYISIRAQSSTSEVGGIQIQIQDNPNIITFYSISNTNGAFDYDYYQDDGSITFFILNTNQNQISQNEFLLTELLFKLNDNISYDSYGQVIDLLFENILISDFNSNPIEPLTNAPSIDIGYKGDVSLDGQINISDIILIVNIIVNNYTPSDYQLWACDTINDDLINLFDIINIINIILEQS